MSSTAFGRHHTTHAMGHHFILLCFHSGISNGPLSLPTATEMTLIEEKFEVY